MKYADDAPRLPSVADIEAAELCRGLETYLVGQQADEDQQGRIFHHHTIYVGPLGEVPLPEVLDRLSDNPTLLSSWCCKELGWIYGTSIRDAVIWAQQRMG